MSKQCPNCDAVLKTLIELKAHVKEKHNGIIVLDDNPVSIATYLEEFEET